GSVAALVGPTAVGKTEVSIEVADRLGAEIVSLDSMQVYVGMDVGTAKPGTEVLRRVPHHLIDRFPPTHDLAVAEFQTLAREAIADIVARDRLPLLVGGSGLYFRAVVDDLEFPPRDEAVRTDLESEAEAIGAEALHVRLTEIDPLAASRIAPANARRTIRALEVIALTNRPFSENDAWDRYESRYRLRVAGLRRDRSELRSRIAARVQEMLDAGLQEEAERIVASGMGRTARQALGYRQVLDAEPGTTAPELAESITKATSRFARRQESWFKSDPRVTWFEADDPNLTSLLIAHLTPGSS
ncbi:MAG: tRNA dimethylallyltransferase, partial [Actinomycetota bacterium]|nr:tRNA dimethylallyltransferase [Actinomycetota bacterium]